MFNTYIILQTWVPRVLAYLGSSSTARAADAAADAATTSHSNAASLDLLRADTEPDLLFRSLGFSGVWRRGSSV